MLKPKELQIQLGQGYKCKYFTKHSSNTTMLVETPFTLPDGTPIEVYVSPINQVKDDGVVLSDLGKTTMWLFYLTNLDNIEKPQGFAACWIELLPKRLHSPNSNIPSSEELFIAIPMFVKRLQSFVRDVLEEVEEKRKEYGNKM